MGSETIFAAIRKVGSGARNIQMPSLKPLIRLVALNVLLATLLTGAAEAATATYTLSWNANTEPDVIGYVLSWGTTPGSYTTGSQWIPGISTVQTTVTLDAATTYYLVLQAKNSANLLSGYSTQVSTSGN